MDLKGARETHQLALAFAKLLHEQLGPKSMGEIIARNCESRHTQGCASQNYCDANMVMAEAYEVALARAPILSEEFHPDPQAVDADIALWNRAWNLARHNDFDGNKITEQVDRLVVEAAARAAVQTACSLIRAHLNQCPDCESGNESDDGISGGQQHGAQCVALPALQDYLLGYLQAQRMAPQPIAPEDGERAGLVTSRPHVR